MHKHTWKMETVPIHGTDDLREVTRGADLEIVQLKPGKLRGKIRHFGIGGLGISVGRFSSEIRMRGSLHQERVVLGTVLESAGRVTQWWKDVRPGDVGVFPALVEFDAIHSGGAAYLVVSISLEELLSTLHGEEHLADPAFWSTKGVYQTNPRVSAAMLRRLTEIMSAIEPKSSANFDHGTDFLKRSIIESFLTSLMNASPSPRGETYTGARLVSEAEDYVDAMGGRPVHISELSSALRVPRRSLHRAFADTLGMGPAAYLRSRRLSAIRSALSRSDPATVSIGELAFEHGFPEAGRFARYYRAHFGETPSQTARAPR